MTNRTTTPRITVHEMIYHRAQAEIAGRQHRYTDESHHLGRVAELRWRLRRERGIPSLRLS